MGYCFQDSIFVCLFAYMRCVETFRGLFSRFPIVPIFRTLSDIALPWLRFLVYQAMETNPAWSECCIRVGKLLQKASGGCLRFIRLSMARGRL